MATSTFERKIMITDSSSLKKIAKVMSAEAPKKSNSVGPFSKKDRDRGEELLMRCQLRSNH